MVGFETFLRKLGPNGIDCVMRMNCEYEKQLKNL